MERVNIKACGRAGARREGDVIWRIPTGLGADIYLYLDAGVPIAERQLDGRPHTGLPRRLLWQQIIAEKRLKPGDRLPPLLLLMLYNGGPRGSAETDTAALVALPKGRAEGLVEGRQKAQSDILLRHLERRFGPVPRDLRQRIDAAGSATLDRWLDRILDAPTRDAVFDE